MNKGQSMINNLKSVRGNRYSNDKALEKLAKAKEKTGLSEQRVLINMVLYAFENDPKYETERNLVINKTEPSEKAKQLGIPVNLAPYIVHTLHVHCQSLHSRVLFI